MKKIILLHVLFISLACNGFCEQDPFKELEITPITLSQTEQGEAVANQAVNLAKIEKGIERLVFIQQSSNKLLVMIGATPLIVFMLYLLNKGFANSSS